MSKSSLKFRKISSSHLLLFFLATVFYFSFSGCWKNVPSKHYYILTFPMPDSTSTAKYPYSIRVKDFSISPTYNRNQLVFRYSVHELEYYNYRLWTQKPQKMVSDLVRKRLMRSGLFQSVVSRLGDTAPDFTLSGEIDAIEELDSDEHWYAHLAMTLYLQNFKDSTVVWKYAFDERRKVLVKEPKIIVRTLSEILEREMEKACQQLDSYFASQMSSRTINNSENEADKKKESPRQSEENSPTIEPGKYGTEETSSDSIELSSEDETLNEDAFHFIPHLSNWYDHPQMLSDVTTVPTGKGAIFVPALSSPEREPVIIVYRDGEKFLSAAPGQRIVLDPGEYRIKIGSGTIEQMFDCTATVKELQITVIEPFWASLAVNVVDEHFIPFRGTYEIIAIPSREEYGIGFGADAERGEETKVWVLPEGLYKIIRAGGTYRDRTNFSTVYIQAGQLTSYTLVLERDTGDFLGAGIIEEEEGSSFQKKWRVRALIGGDVLFINQTDNTSGQLEGWTTTGNIFLDSVSTFRSNRQNLNLRLEIEEGMVKRPDENAQTLNDRLYFHTIYTYLLHEKFGPYVRAGIETSLSNRYYYYSTDGPQNALIFPADKKRAYRPDQERRVLLGDSFAPIQFKEGIGGNLNLFTRDYLDLSLRLGLGARQYYANDFLTLLEETDDDAILQEVADYSIDGFETSIVAFARTTRYIAWSFEFDSLFPFDQPNDYIMTLRNIVSIRLVTFASFNYKLDLIRDPNVNEEYPTSLQHQFLIRFSYNLF